MASGISFARCANNKDIARGSIRLSLGHGSFAIFRNKASALADDQLTNAGPAARFGVADTQRVKESPERAGAFKVSAYEGNLGIKVP